MEKKTVSTKKVEKIHRYHKQQHSEIQKKVDFEKQRFEALRKSFDEYKKQVKPKLDEHEVLVNRLAQTSSQLTSAIDRLRSNNEAMANFQVTLEELSKDYERLNAAYQNMKTQLQNINMPPLLSVTRTSQLSGKENTLHLPVTEAQLMQYELGNDLLQDCFPQLTAPEREFIKSGITPEEWEEMFGPRPSEDDEDVEEDNEPAGEPF